MPSAAKVTLLRIQYKLLASPKSRAIAWYKLAMHCRHTNFIWFAFSRMFMSATESNEITYGNQIKCDFIQNWFKQIDEYTPIWNADYTHTTNIDCRLAFIFSFVCFDWVYLACAVICHVCCLGLIRIEYGFKMRLNEYGFICAVCRLIISIKAPLWRVCGYLIGDFYHYNCLLQSFQIPYSLVWWIH